MNVKNIAGPKITERAQAQRERILAAAQQCFIQHGFHAASIAEIAEASAMSPGLIYRYFDSKSSIILAIIERLVEESRLNIRALHDAPDLAQAVFDIFDSWRRADSKVMNAALFLEMSAEATRNPVIAHALIDSDHQLRSEISKWLSAAPAIGGKGLPKTIAQQRAITFQCFMEGLAVRAVREPALETQLLEDTIDQFVGMLISK